MPIEITTATNAEKAGIRDALDVPAKTHTHLASQISDSTTAGRALLTAATAQAQRTALDIFLSYANLAAFPANGNFQRLYLALDTQKTYVWNGTGYTEISPNQHARTGTNNTNVGETALSSASLSGAGNVAVGTESLQANTSGAYNTAVGYASLRANITGFSNTASGVNALLLNTFGANNTANGLNALLSNTTGNNNTASGVNALQENINGANNTAVGAGSGDTIISGTNNTIIGFFADVDSGERNNCVVLGNSTISPAVDGSLAIGATGGNAMGNLVTTSGGTSANQDLIIYLNGTKYRIALKV
jgi:hypothetical protein